MKNQLGSYGPRPLEPIGSVTPSTPGRAALTDRAAGPVGGGAQNTGRPPSDSVGVEGAAREVTRNLPAAYQVPQTFEEIMSGSGSFAGFSAVSLWLTCPEASRLRARGVTRREDKASFDGKLSSLSFGTLAHAMRAVRLARGTDFMRGWFDAVIRPNVPAPDALKLDLMFRIYESQWPWGSDPWDVLGIECEVVSDVGGMLRSVRYDTVIRFRDGSGVFSWEAKTAARSSNLDTYNPQGMCQTALWNVNPFLVSQYGPMRGVLFDQLVKTETPKCDRIGPRYFGRSHQMLALRYLRQAEQVKYEVGPDGRYPQMLHACWGKYSPCAYIGLCHEEEYGNYEVTGEDGEAEPYAPGM